MNVVVEDVLENGKNVKNVQEVGDFEMANVVEDGRNRVRTQGLEKGGFGRMLLKRTLPRLVLYAVKIAIAKHASVWMHNNKD
ncbi:hypothetical protein L484_023841 [Morus notabilis]|uniref:Uncharacterized protein n=1 Tax=Morus notabilis TaxID=981085 RepID=W9RDF2_9ROSA|nr:hypothetical protein L484_023841 [Morus notabilis]